MPLSSPSQFLPVLLYDVAVVVVIIVLCLGFSHDFLPFLIVFFSGVQINPALSVAIP
jgi:hypothetical protein